MKAGFSLVELSIVLVILGLLTGGILAGQSLIRASELRKITTDAQRFMAATNSFRDKYFSQPGDFPNATRFWSGTGNGDGNGQLYPQDEQVDAWQHLALAGMIEGTYDGIWDGSGYNPAGSNSPKGPVSGSVWAMQGDFTPAGNWAVFTRVGNHLTLSGDLNHASSTTGILTGSDSWTIDTKMDDGMAQYGSVMAAGTALCVNNSVANAPNSSVNYALNRRELACVMYFY